VNGRIMRAMDSVRESIRVGEQDAKEPYEQPRLVRYGTIEELTAALAAPKQGVDPIASLI
jgi:hypothetical protein